MVHPIVAQLTPSPEQLPAVRARARSVVVTAGAGAGKTRTLVARYLHLLAREELAPRHIAAITFTRKAAREMRNRVRAAIGHYLATLSDPQERAFWDRRYSQLDAARIGTIHQLSTEILRAHPAEAAVDPRFEVLDEAHATLLQNQAVEQALAWAAEDAEGVRLFRLLGERRLRAVAAQLLQERLQVQTVDCSPPQEILTRWQQALAAQQARALADLERHPQWQAHAATLRAHEPHRPDDRMALQREQALGALAAAASTPDLARKQEALAALAAINLRGGSQKAWPGGKEQLAAVKIALTGLRELWEEQAKIHALALTSVDRALAAALPALHRLFAHADRTYGRLKEERHVLDFDDLEARALHLLQTAPAVRQRWQAELGAILVDEYQDTNSRQRDLINLLHGPQNRLFIVGDAKQSIYRFRGAEVAVFREERRRIAAGTGAGHNLARSYRPHAALLQGLNALLREVMGTAADPRQPWREPFAPLTHHRAAPTKSVDPPYISLQLALGNKEEALPLAAQALAAEIARLVQDEQGNVGYGDIAILCRASTSFPYYEDVLDQWGIPYLTVAGRGFYRRPEIRDLLNVLRALLDPTDDLALLGALRSPVAGYADPELFTLRREQQAAGAPSLWAFLAPEANRFLSLLRQLHTRAGRQPVADLLKAFLDESDYRAALRQAGQLRALRNVEKLLALAHESGIVSVGEFLEYIANVSATSSREGEARATAGNAVQIMSVHQAKGLEFPIVAIGDLNKQSGGRVDLLIRSDWGILPYLKDEEENVPLAFSLAKAEEEAQEAAEAQRLLYVAATRARDKLILNGNLQLTRSGRPGWLSGWLQELAGPLDLAAHTVELDPDGDRAVTRQLRVGPAAVACTFYEPGHRLPPPPSSAPSSATRLRHWHAPLVDPVAAAPALAAGETPRRVWRVIPEQEASRRAPSWLVGALVHEALAAWRFPDDDAGSAFARWAEVRAREYGLADRHQIEHARNHTLRLLRRFRRHPLFQQIDGSRRLHELPYTIAGAAGPERGQVDLLYCHADQWHVVDFKSDRFHNRHHLQRMLAAKGYEDQLRRYGQAVAHLLGQTPACTLCLLDFAGHIRLHPVPLGSP